MRNFVWIILSLFAAATKPGCCGAAGEFVNAKTSTIDELEDSRQVTASDTFSGTLRRAGASWPRQRSIFSRSFTSKKVLLQLAAALTSLSVLLFLIVRCGHSIRSGTSSSKATAKRRLALESGPGACDGASPGNNDPGEILRGLLTLFGEDASPLSSEEKDLIEQAKAKVDEFISKREAARLVVSSLVEEAAALQAQVNTHAPGSPQHAQAQQTLQAKTAAQAEAEAKKEELEARLEFWRGCQRCHVRALVLILPTDDGRAPPSAAAALAVALAELIMDSGLPHPQALTAEQSVQAQALALNANFIVSGHKATMDHAAGQQKAPEGFYEGVLAAKEAITRAEGLAGLLAAAGVGVEAEGLRAAALELEAAIETAMEKFKDEEEGEQGGQQAVEEVSGDSDLETG